MANFVLEDNVPLPPEGTRGRGSKYPWAQMEVGQSFFIEGGKRATIRTSALTYKKAHPGWDYTTAEEEGGLRVWRTA